MFFKKILVGFIILGILGFLYGDRIFYFQANLMISWMYDFPAYEAFERIVYYYPNSPYKHESMKMMEILLKRNYDLRKYLAFRDKDLNKKQKNLQKLEEYR